jgi:hypothetical protein
VLVALQIATGFLQAVSVPVAALALGGVALVLAVVNAAVGSDERPGGDAVAPSSAQVFKDLQVVVGDRVARSAAAIYGAYSLALGVAESVTFAHLVSEGASRGLTVAASVVPIAVIIAVPSKSTRFSVGGTGPSWRS